MYHERVTNNFYMGTSTMGTGVQIITFCIDAKMALIVLPIVTPIKVTVTTPIMNPLFTQIAILIVKNSKLNCQLLFPPKLSTI